LRHAPPGPVGAGAAGRAAAAGGVVEAGACAVTAGVGVSVAAGVCADVGIAAAANHIAQIAAMQPRNVACFDRIGRLPGYLRLIRPNMRSSKQLNQHTKRRRTGR